MSSKRDYAREYRRKNKNITNQKSREYRARTRLILLYFVGGKKGLKCKQCNFRDFRALQIDHVFGGGSKEINSKSKLKDNVKYLEHIKKNPSLYQLLCANCNWIKKHDQEENRPRINHEVTE